MFDTPYPLILLILIPASKRPASPCCAGFKLWWFLTNMDHDFVDAANIILPKIMDIADFTPSPILSSVPHVLQASRCGGS
jgi:hypothetical protein